MQRGTQSAAEGVEARATALAEGVAGQRVSAGMWRGELEKVGEDFISRPRRDAYLRACCFDVLRASEPRRQTRTMVCTQSTAIRCED